MIAPPSEADQLAFLANFQRVLDEGQFVATYKFALLIALVEYAVEYADDSGDALSVSLDAIAERFIALYWRHTRPFAGGEVRQNTGRNIAVLGHVQRLQAVHPRLAEARRAPGWPAARSDVAKIVEKMPLWRLQRLRGGFVLPFLYDDTLDEGSIRLKAGVAYCLRRFSSLLLGIVRNAWTVYVRNNPRNAYLTAAGETLEGFLFGEPRVDLSAVREVMWDLQSGRCFYCGDAMRHTVHVDHFVPWSTYPSNLGHNLVLAHSRCNEDKSDLLPDVDHLAHWWARNDREGDALSDELARRGVTSDAHATRGIAEWAYRRAVGLGALVWEGVGQVRPLPTDAPLPFRTVART